MISVIAILCIPLVGINQRQPIAINISQDVHEPGFYPTPVHPAEDMENA
jgi:hypothetical protein